MALSRVQHQLRYPYPANPDGYYYWTIAHTVDTPDPTNFPAYVGHVEDVVRVTMHEDAQVNRVRVQAPPNSDPPLENAFVFNAPGFSPYTDGVILVNAIRVSWYVGTVLVGYRLLRALLTNGQIEDGRISASLRAYVEDYYVTGCLALGCRDNAGNAWTSAYVHDAISTWQLRHGTKRRERGPITP
jgi:hypothetical protein